ncbi:glycosyltransferase family 4 protein [Bacillus haimaensis]|uniref:glycosyltransferase family 4 protein n=1 Tax=Bacillus haimaensis TaxID=3160967 RepID=UPI003AA8FFED
MKILIVTNMYPFENMDYFGNFLKKEVEYIQSQNIEVEVLFLNGRDNKINYLTGLMKFLNIYREFDIIHYHHSYIAWYSFFVKNKKQIFTIHEGGNIKIINNLLIPHYGHGRKGYIEKLFKMFNLRKHILNQMNRIIITKYSDKPLTYNDKKVIQNPMGIDFNKFIIINKEKARLELGMDINDIILFFPHEPRKEKNVELFYDIVESLKLRTSKNIKAIYGGKISTNDMYKYINAADICYLTSNFEASPTIVKESLACGTPILCSNVGDLEELFDPVFTTFICNNCEEFVEKSMEILDKPINRDNIREFLQSKGMDYKTTSENVLKIYKEEMGK